MRAHSIRLLPTRFTLVMALFFVVQNGFGQASTANFTFTAGSNGSLTDMSSGTIQLISPNVDGLNTGTFSVANNIGFTFYFMGKPYSKFVATEDGVIRIGSSLSPIDRVPELDVDEPRLIPFSCDMRTGSNGKVHYKVTGSAPNRIFIIEWKNMIIPYPLSSQIGKSTFQARLYETTNVIEYVYGYMNVQDFENNNTPAGEDDFGGIGFSNTNATNGVISKTSNFTSSNVSLSSPATQLLHTSITSAASIGEISGLSSTTNGYRTIYKFTPIAPPAAPSALNFTDVTQTSITVNWTDNSSTEAYFLIYRSEIDGGPYDLVATLNKNVTSSVVNGLPSKMYYFKVLAVNEGGISEELTGSQATDAAGEISSRASGNWSDVSTWTGGVLPTATDNVTITGGFIVTIDNTAAVCNNLIVENANTLEFIDGSGDATLTADGDITVANGGTFTVNAAASGGTRTLVIGNRTYANAHLTVDGAFQMYNGVNAWANVEFKGIDDGIISGSGTPCNFYSLTINKGTDTSSVLDVQRSITIESPTSAGNRLVLTNGTLKISSDTDITPYYGAVTLVSANSRLWMNHSDATLGAVGGTTGSAATGTTAITAGGIVQITSGALSFGSGSDLFNVGGTLILESADAVLNHFGKLNLSNGGYLIMSDGQINLDPRATNNLSGYTFELGTTAFALVTGGTITFVDPQTNTGTGDFYIPDTGESNKNFIGSTFSFGDGTSNTNGSASGFVIRVPVNYHLSLGNIKVNNTGGSNRFVSMRKSDNTPNGNNFLIQDLNIVAGEFRIYTTSGNDYVIDVFGDIINNGTINAANSNNGIRFVGSSAQDYSGSGTVSSSELEIEINNSSGVTLSSPLTALNLILTNGTLTTTSTNILTLLSGSSTSAGTTSSYVSGPLKRILPTAAGSTTIAFPVGKGYYNMIELVNLSTTDSDVEVVAEVFDAACGGSYTNGNYILNSNRYWTLNITANTGNFTNSLIRVTETGTTTGQLLTHCATLGGVHTTFSDVGGTSGYTIISNASINNTNTANYLAIASDYLIGDYNVGSGETYTSLSGASDGFFAAVNASGLRGNVTVKVTSDLTETGEVALNEWNEANGSDFGMTIVSSTSTLRTISGGVNKESEGGPGAMIRFNGADRVNINGGAGKYLTFRNYTSIDASNTSATFEFLNGSENIYLQNCTIENHNNTTSTQGTITIGSGANTNISILGNDIRNATTGDEKYAYAAIYSNNASNSAITVSNNNIFNFGNYGLLLEDAGDSWTISGNSFYKDLTDDLSAISQTGIYLNGGSGHTLSGNFIGGSAASAGGSWTNNDDSPYIKGIVLDVLSDATTTLSGNFVSNFNVQSSSGTAFVGIEVLNGDVNVGNGLGNTISSITSGATSVTGLYTSSDANSVLITNNNIISLTASGTASNVHLYGINHAGNALANISSNTIQALSCAGSSTDIINQTVAAVFCSGASAEPQIYSNTITNIDASNTGAVQTNASGILINQASSPKIYKNKIYDIKNQSTLVAGSVPPTTNGIVLYQPVTSAEISNNQLTIGASQTTYATCHGIWLNGQPASSTNVSIDYNSILVAGSPSGGTWPSFNLLRGDYAATSLANQNLSVLNNLFANSRNGGGTNYMYGNSMASPETGWASNYNVLVGTALNVGLWNSTVYNFADWKSNTSSDASSYFYASTAGPSDGENIVITNLFTGIGSGDLSLVTANSECWIANGTANPLTTVATDYLNVDRSTTIAGGAADCGAFEFEPDALVEPLAATENTAPVDAGTSNYTLGGKQLASIVWHGTNLPTAVTLKYYPGTNPVNLSSGKKSNAYWNIEPTGGTIADYTYDLTLYYTDNVLFEIDDESAVNIAKDPVYYPTVADFIDDWRTYKASASSAVDNYITISGLIGFSNFALVSGLNPLPIELTKFNVLGLANKVFVSWETASEENNDFFSIERSTDATNWSVIGTQQGAGTSNITQRYEFFDNAPVYGNSYYRLKQTDFNGDFSYSKIEAVYFGANYQNLITGYYLEANDALVIQNSFDSNLKAQINIYTLYGIKAYTTEALLSIDNNTFALNNLASGVYYAVIETETGSNVIQFVK